MAKRDHVTRSVGSGVSADVFHITKRGKVWVVKIYRRDFQESKKDYKERARHEYDVLVQLLHPNIVTVLEFKVLLVRKQASLWFPGGGTIDLWQLCKREPRLEMKERLCFWRQICAGIEYLHGKGICHRDIKLENCVLSNSGSVQLIDFATAAPLSREAVGLVGSPRYAAPETFLQITYAGAPADIWSLGIVLHWLVHRRFPWKSATRDDPEFQSHSAPQEESDSARDSDPEVGLWLLVRLQPSQRPAVGDLSSQWWYKNVPFCQYSIQGTSCGIDHTRLITTYSV